MSVDYSKIENTLLTRIEEDYLMQNLEQMLVVVGSDYRLTPSERQTLNGINHTNKGFVQDALEAIRAFSDMLPGYIDQASMENTWEYYLQLERAFLHLERLFEVIRDRKQTAGAILFRDARVVYNVLKAGENNSIGGLEALLKRMKARFRKQGNLGAASPEMVTPDSEATIVAFAPDGDAGGNSIVADGGSGGSTSLAA